MNELMDYVKKPESPDCNFRLGLFYESAKQYSAAASFYLRCAELTSHKNQRYETLLRLYLCVRALGDRSSTCEHILRQAISLCPNYGIGYFFMTQIYELKNDWSSVYFYSSLGLQTEHHPIFESSFDYQYYYLWFQKAAAAWWIGKADEARLLYRHILNVYLGDLSETYKKLLETNLCSLGSGPPEECMHIYKKNQFERLRYKFKNSNNIEQNFSQVYQDLFVLSILDGKQNGTYLEIGAAQPFYGSNTALLETLFGWKGVGIEYDKDRANQHSVRNNPIICTDATLIDYDKFISQHFSSEVIDYLQLDIEPARNTFNVLRKIPFNKYKFRVITYEHDHYIDIEKKYRIESRKYLESLGYKLLVNDVSPRENCSFEDWWIHPELVDVQITKIYEILIGNPINLAENVIFR